MSKNFTPQEIIDLQNKLSYANDLLKEFCDMFIINYADNDQLNLLIKVKEHLEKSK